MADFDGTIRRWGHMIEKQWGSERTSDGGFDVQGCMTPVPSVGQTILLADGEYRFTRVDRRENPKDLFFGHIVPHGNHRMESEPVASQ